ncbi:hypothetical protein JHK85_019527 [Glycine max]|nr:hypothetical protein JHK85_019527 [Glycine max]
MSSSHRHQFNNNLTCLAQLEISPRKQEKGWEKRAASASKLTLLAKKLHPDRNKDDLEAEKKFQ